jgi:hypothetical protein
MLEEGYVLTFRYRKKAEQQGARDAILQEKSADEKVGGALGQTGMLKCLCYYGGS